MAEVKPLSGGKIPSVSPDPYAKLTADNIGKAQIGMPGPDGSVQPLGSGTGSTSPTTTLEMPQGVTPAQAAQMQAAFAAIMKGQGPTQPNAQTLNQPPPVAVVSHDQPRMWNPNQPFQATARLSDMERTVEPGANNPNMVMPNAPVSVKLNPKPDCPVVLIDAYVMLKRMLDGRWILPGGATTEVSTMMQRLKMEIETV